MKILIYEWNGFCQRDLKEILRAQGHSVERIGYVVKEKCADRFFEEKLAERLKKGYDCVVSFNFYPSVALCCRDAGILYLSWIYDGEDFGLYHTAVHYETNRIFTFDSSMAARLRERGAKHVWYLPLGANLKRLDALSLSEEEREKYRADVSFIGNLYQNKISLDQYQYPPYVKGFLEGAIQAQEKINTSLFLEDMLTEKDIEAMAEKIPAMDGRYTIEPRDMVLTLLTTSVTKRERFHIMKALSERFTVDLYTYSDTQGLPRIRRHGTISYFADMPKLFRCSKINLNITHRMIRTGIPLRVIDVLGAGGFLMSNYQQDMGEDFRDGENLAIYYSLEDLCEKAAFYLEHDEERTRIAANGRRLAAEKFSLEDCAAVMLRTAF